MAQNPVCGIFGQIGPTALRVHGDVRGQPSLETTYRKHLHEIQPWLAGRMAFCIDDEVCCPLCGQLLAVGKHLFELPEQDEVVPGTVIDKDLRYRVMS